jgi:hypothetical protein
MRTIDLEGPEGNAFMLAAIAKRWNKQLGSNVGLDLFSCDSYEQVLNTFDAMFGGLIAYEFINDPRDPETREDSDE